MIPIKLKSISLNKIDDIISLSKAASNSSVLANDDTENNLEETIEAVIENYLLTCSSKKVELTQFLVSLNMNEIIEILALYYFFSKLTYDASIVSDEDIYSFWDICNTNADNDITRIGLGNMIDFIKERSNLAVILSTATMNLK